MLKEGTRLTLWRNGSDFAYFVVLLEDAARDGLFCREIGTGRWFFFPWQCINYIEVDRK